MLPAPLIELLQPLVGKIYSATFVGGGCIAQATRLETERGGYFLKWGSGALADTFPAEATGLRALAKAAQSLVIPAVLSADEGPPGFLIMDWIESGRPGPGFWSEFGRGLAGLHAFTGPDYGYPTENFIGRTPQRNTPHPAWPAFFRACRLEPLRALAEQAGLWQANWNAGYDGLSRRLDDLLPQTPPASLLHGDLWSGNYLVTAAGAPGLVDPAVYYGHGEADLAMTELFGGFESSFYAAYRETIPLESGYPERRDIYNLYHLLNHLILFGGSYAVAVARIVTRYK